MNMDSVLWAKFDMSSLIKPIENLKSFDTMIRCGQWTEQYTPEHQTSLVLTANNL